MFSDVPITSKYYKAAQYCETKKIINGTGNGKFSPNNDIIVEHWCIMLMRASMTATTNPVTDCYRRGWINTITVQMPQSSMCREILYESAFKAFRFETYGLKTMDAAVKIGLCEKKDKPTDIMSRGEAIYTIYKLSTNDVKIDKPQIVKDVNLVNYDGENTDNFIAELNKIPQEIIADFKSAGWSYHIDYAYTSRFNSKNINCSGVTQYSERTIYVAVPQATLHEFGHFLNHRMSKPTIIQELFNREGSKSKFLSDYSNTNSEEFFAEAFAYYINNKNNSSMIEVMKRYLPYTYAYLTLLEFNGWKKIV